jgi:hypothetical protein
MGRYFTEKEEVERAVAIAEVKRGQRLEVRLQR